MKTKHLEMHAHVGGTKHLGELTSSRMLLEACRVAEARGVLEVGCGMSIKLVGMLDHLASKRGDLTITRAWRCALERRWLPSKLKVGPS